MLEPGRELQCPMVESLPNKNVKLYNSPTGRHLVLVSADGTERPVHKVILAVTSPVFERIFDSNMEECRTGRYVLEDISTKTLDALLKYMYYKGLEILKEEAVGLLKAAEKYEMSDLKEHCEEDLIAGINMENLVDCCNWATSFLPLT
ncbi:hypothetical protein RvY_14197 [Ramazzottius varieornatus]|uniref:BTB domain-containing protein n=1 Tax=Ramazzottius varieornatus TaxID=947166 RepID=A0A1D1VS64_RAMVA|nr:hypothetical protein RvY_14197 [Ramazzottius varieornatus]